MKGRLKAARSRQRGGARDSFRETPPVDGGPRPGVREDRLRSEAVQNVERRAQLEEGLVLSKIDRDEAADERGRAALEPLAELPVLAEIAARAELRSRVARLGNRVEHVLRAWDVRQHADRQFERAVA